MKKWRKKYEWMLYASCVSDPRHTGELDIGLGDTPRAPLTVQDLRGAARVCAGCGVRRECMRWALDENCCAVVVAGVYLPDPALKGMLRKSRSTLRKLLAEESDEKQK